MSTVISLADAPEVQPLTMSEWLASDGGRRCVICARFRRRSDLYIVGGQNCGHELLTAGGQAMHLSITTQPVCGACLRKEQGQ